MTCFWPMPALCEITYFDDQYYDQIFPPGFFAELAGLMELEETQSNIAALRAGHHRAFAAFMAGQSERDNFQPLKAENARLERVAKDAERLWASLGALYEFGQTQERLAQEVRDIPTHHTTPEGQTLAALLSERPNNPFFDLRALLSDLGMSAKRAIIAKPKKNTPIGPDFDPSEIEARLLAMDPNYRGDDASNLALWHQRSEVHKFSGEDALCRFVAVFKPVWEALSPHPFTQGHYYDKIGHSPSRTVAALALSLSRHAPDMTEQNIVTALRKALAG